MYIDAIKLSMHTFINIVLKSNSNEADIGIYYIVSLKENAMQFFFVFWFFLKKLLHKQQKCDTIIL